jgi:outer membrane protein assembly factor BamB
MGDQIFTVTHTRGAQEMFLTVVNFTTGKMEWNVSLGTPATATNNYRGQPEYPVPVLLHRMGMIYVLTNNGATICVSIPGKRVEWAFTYDMKPLPDSNMWWGYRARPAVETFGVLMVNEGILYIKEQGNACMYALDLSGAAPTLKWKRPVDDCDMLASIDDKQIYLLGEDVAAMDVQTRTLQWSTKLPMQTGPRSAGHLERQYLRLHQPRRVSGRQQER